jgi:hypothetical protein
VVPSLLVVQKDIGRLMTSYRRGMLGRRTPVRERMVFGLSTLGAGGVLAATVGYLIAQQHVAPWVAGLTGAMAQTSPGLASLMVMVAGVLVVATIALLVNALARRGLRGS